MALGDAHSVLSEAIQSIKNLISQEKWLDAHRACLEILRFDPENLKVIRLKNFIEKKVKKINIKALKEDLKNMQPLWNEKKYDVLLEHLKDLAPYQKDYLPLKKFINKVEKAYLEDIKAQQLKYYEQEIKSIEGLLQNRKYQEAIRTGQKLRIMKLNDARTKKILQTVKEAWINFELEKNKKVLSGENYEDMLLVIQKIRKIDPNSKRLNDLMDSIKKKYQQYRIMEKRDFIYKGFEKAGTLMQLRKFDKAMEVTKEILDIDPENKKALKIFKKSKRKMKKSMDNELRKQMKSAYKQMKVQYKEDKSKFLKI